MLCNGHFSALEYYIFVAHERGIKIKSNVRMSRSVPFRAGVLSVIEVLQKSQLPLTANIESIFSTQPAHKFI